MKKIYELLEEEKNEVKTYSLSDTNVDIKWDREITPQESYCHDEIIVGHQFTATNVMTNEQFKIKIVVELHCDVERRYLTLFIDGNINEINEMTWDEFKTLFTGEWYK